LFLAWRYGGEDPYRTYNGLDQGYRPLGHPEETARPPTYPTRLRMFLYGCGMVAHDNDSKLAGAKTSSKVMRALGG
jgi:hypothetical protein